MLGLDQFLRESLSLLSESVGAVEITGIRCGFRLLHELLDLIHHVLLVWGELSSLDVLQVLPARSQRLDGFVPLGLVVFTGLAR